MKNIVAIIPARGGSKRLPNKNILPLNGKPLLFHTIAHAQKSKLVKRILVSTDDNKIAEVSYNYGAEVVRRPKKISGGSATSESALLHALDHINIRTADFPDLIVFLQCTSPIRKDDDIDRAIETLLNQGADSLFSACRFYKYLWKLHNQNIASINYDYTKRWREQDFPLQYMENGSIYVFKPWVLKEYGNRLGGKITIFEMDYWNSFQNDSLEDLKLCELILNNKLYKDK